MMKSLRQAWRAQQFQPGLLGVLANPFFLARRALWMAVGKLAAHARGRLLDVGCGSQPYRALFQVEQYIGLEVESAAARARGLADAYYDGDRFPFDDGHFDTVLCNQVLEHVFNPDQFVGEIWRVLAPGGRLLLTVPFVWDEHEQPFDYARYSSFGLRALLERRGFRVIEQHKLLADSSLLFQLTNAYLYKTVRSRFRGVNILVNVVLMAPLSLLGWLAGRVLPQNPDLFLDQAVVAEKLP